MLFKRLIAYLAPYKGVFVIGQIAMLVATAAGLAFPWAVREVFDSLFAQLDMQVLLGAIGLLAVIFLAREGANYFKTYTLDLVGIKIIRDLRDQLYQKLLELSLGYYNNQRSGELTSSMTNDMNMVQGGLAQGLAYIIQQVLSLIFVTLLLVRLDPVLTLTVFAIVPLIILTSKVMGDKIKALAQSTQERLASLMSILGESISGIDVIKAFVLENYALGMFRDENDAILNKSARSIRISAGARLIIGLLNSTFTLVIIGLGGYRVARGHLSPPDLIAFILYAEMVIGPIAMLAGIYIEINKMMAAFRRITDILDAREVISNRELEPSAVAQLPAHPLSLSKNRCLSQSKAETISGAMTFENVAFSYNGESNILADIDLDIPAGETVALVGPSGVGKSTLVKLIPRFYDPTAGRMLIDGLDSQTLDLDFLRSQIAIVPQDTYLFGISIYANIACGRPDATEDEIIKAAQLANAHEFILQQPHGYETHIGERGARLSGGQRQRLAIARAFLKNPRILILDEATSALDTHAERLVQEALDKLMVGRTTIIIAHRLSTIQNADKIVVLHAKRAQDSSPTAIPPARFAANGSEGTVLDTGTHDQLLGRCPLYRDLYRSAKPHLEAGVLGANTDLAHQQNSTVQ